MAATPEESDFTSIQERLYEQAIEENKPSVHVHILIGILPSLSVSRAVQFLKGKSSHKLLSEFSSLKKRYWGQYLWARGYWLASSGHVTDEVWKGYIKNQKPDDPGDDFSVL